jgi:Zn finger protein HypA/HybF involved in hydrogenase expression
MENEKPRTVKVMIECNECGRKFIKTISLRTFEIQCPRCRSFDTEPTGE